MGSKGELSNQAQASRPVEASYGDRVGMRRFELDWLRILAILAVFILHSLHFFDPYPWHVKNPVTYPALTIAALFFITWVMPLIFVVSGASTYYALGKHPPRRFLKERSLRLLLPLAIGVFTHAAWQVYLERVTYGQFQGSFFAFYPHYFEGFYGSGGNFAWFGIHLWYLAVLFLISLVLLPLLAWLRRGSGQWLLSRLGRYLAFPGGIYLPALLIVLPAVFLNPNSFVGAPYFGGWSIGAYGFIFVNGFLIVSEARLYDQVRRLRWLSLIMAVTLSVSLLVTIGRDGAVAAVTEHDPVLWAARSVDAWLLILTILGFSAQHLRIPARLLPYANEAVLPFYILHQTVLVSVGHVVVHSPVPDLLKWLFITTTSLVLCLLLYEFLVRRFNPLRFLFGMKPLPAMPTQPAGAVQPS